MTKADDFLSLIKKIVKTPDELTKSDQKILMKPVEHPSDSFVIGTDRLGGDKLWGGKFTDNVS